MTSLVSKRAVAAGAAGMAVAAAAGIALWWPGDSDAASGAAEGTGGVVDVVRQTLSDSERVSGALTYANTTTVTATGEGILTALAAEGEILGRGDIAYRVNDEPVALLFGDLPMWRPLDRSVSDGRDVEQLERNLKRLGYDPGEVDGNFTWATEVALREFQDDIGAEVTGELAPGDVIIHPGRVRVGGIAATVGQPLTPGVELFVASSTDQVVTVELDPRDEALAEVGLAAEVTLPDGRRVAATIDAVGVVESTTSPDGATTSVLPVTLALDDPEELGTLTLAAVHVALTRDSKEDVLAIPVTALVALAEGGHAVHRIVDDEPTLVAVETGSYADGYVEIVDGLDEGDQVRVPA